VSKANQGFEWPVLLECCSSHSDARRLHQLIDRTQDLPALLAQAEEHCILPLLAARVQEAALGASYPDFQSKLSLLNRTQVVLALALTAELFRVLERLSSLDIQVLTTKGPALSVRCYADPVMRQYGDLDLVVRQADIRRATEAMLDLSYQPRVPLAAIDAKRNTGEYVFRKSGTQLLVEFHTESTFRYYPRRLQIEKLFERRASVMIDGRDVPTPSVEDELVLICVHGAKHFWERLMWIADVAALISRQRLDWDCVSAAANEVGAQRILHLGLRLASDLLGAELPSQLETIVRSDRAVAKLATQIEGRLASREPCEIGILDRAAFRVRMRGGLLPGVAYLLRLSLSPTEDDWSKEKGENRSTFMDAMGRPFRLARKYGRRPSR
jgi:hypothetical protein